MDDSFLVRCGQALRDLHRVIDRLARGQWPPIEHRAEGFTFQKFRYQKWGAIVLTGIENRENIRMVERRNRARFLLKTVRSLSRAKDSGRIFSATSRPRRVSRARYTSPIPPAPKGH